MQAIRQYSEIFKVLKESKQADGYGVGVGISEGEGLRTKGKAHG